MNGIDGASIGIITWSTASEGRKDLPPHNGSRLMSRGDKGELSRPYI